MSSPYQCDTIKESSACIVESNIANKINEKETPKSTNKPIQLEILNFKTYEDKLNKIEKMIHENTRDINRFEILIQEKLNTHNFQCQQKQENELYNMLKKWLMKQIFICINGSEVQGVLTEINRECLTLVVLESIYIIPLQRIDFVKMNV
ncbi:MAG: hypothetical protein GX160_02060 [Clostridiales bacterium]|nr:hypothetical protein [Clostridiales bacterium]